MNLINIKSGFHILLIIIKFEFFYEQIYDSYQIYSLIGEENQSLIDIVDYHNLNLIVSTSGNIYQGIPPSKISKTNAT